MVEYAPDRGLVSGGNAENVLKEIESVGKMFDRLNREGELRIRALEDAKLQEGINRDTANRAQGEANMQGQVAEWKLPQGAEPVLNEKGGLAAGGMYRTKAATGILPGEERPQAGPGKHLGAFSNIGVMPGRTYGDFRKEREWAHQLDLAETKARGEDSPADKGIREMMDNTGKDRAALIKANENIMLKPEDRASNEAKIKELYDKEVYLQAQLGRGKASGTKRTDYQPEIKPGWQSYLGKAKSVGEEKAADKPAGATADYLEGKPTTAAPRGESPEGTRIRSSQGDELVKQGGRWVKVASPETTPGPLSEQPPSEDLAQRITSSAQGGVKKAIEAIDRLPSMFLESNSKGPAPSWSGPAMYEGTGDAVDAAGRGVVSRMQEPAGNAISRAQEQFNADVKGGLKVDDAILRVAKRFGASAAKQIAALFESSNASAAPSYRGKIERIQ